MSEATTRIIDAVAARLAPAVGEKVKSWTQLLCDAVSRELLPKLPASSQGLVAAGLLTLSANSGTLASTSEHGFLAIVHHLSLGDEDSARQAWLASSADHRSRMDALDAAFAKSQAERDAHASLWANVRDVALQFLKAAGPAAFSILLSFVGI